MAAAQEKMDQMSTEKTQKNEVRINQKLNEFVQKNRKGLLWGLVALVAIMAALIIGVTVREKLQISAFTKVDAFNERYEALKDYIGSEDGEAASKQADIGALLEELNVFAGKNSGFAAARSYCIIAGIYEAQKKWAEAEKAWTSSAKAAAKSYLAPVSLYNAAAAAEEQGNIEAAITLYTQALGFENVNYIASRAQFSVGRLHESQNNRQAALEAYRNLLSKWPGDPLWSYLAQSRIIVLSD